MFTLLQDQGWQEFEELSGSGSGMEDTDDEDLLASGSGSGAGVPDFTGRLFFRWNSWLALCPVYPHLPPSPALSLPS